MLLAGGHQALHHSRQEVGSAPRPGQQTETRATTMEGQDQQQAPGPLLRRALGTARWGQGGAPQAWGTGSVTRRVWFPEDPRSFRPRVSGGLLESSLYQNIPPSQNGQACLAPAASVLPSLSRARLPDGCLL